jgi:hypothetical protein
MVLIHSLTITHISTQVNNQLHLMLRHELLLKDIHLIKLLILILDLNIIQQLVELKIIQHV